MQVLIDLRPRRLVAAQTRSASPLRVVALVFFCAFTAISLLNIAYVLMSLSRIDDKLESLAADNEGLREQSSNLSSRLSELTAFADMMRGSIEFEQADLPTVEFLSALEGITPIGLKIGSISMSDGVVTMRGSAIADEDVIIFGEGLDELKGVVIEADMPVTTRRTMDGRAISDFSIGCKIRRLGAIVRSAEQ